MYFRPLALMMHQRARLSPVRPLLARGQPTSPAGGCSTRKLGHYIYFFVLFFLFLASISIFTNHYPSKDPTHFAAPCAAAILSPSPPHPRSRVGGLSSGSEALVARSQQPVYQPSNHEGVSVHPRRPGRGTDWKLLLGTLLPRTWHRSRWWVHV